MIKTYTALEARKKPVLKNVKLLAQEKTNGRVIHKTLNENKIDNIKKRELTTD